METEPSDVAARQTTRASVGTASGANLAVTTRLVPRSTSTLPGWTSIAVDALSGVVKRIGETASLVVVKPNSIALANKHPNAGKFKIATVHRRPIPIESAQECDRACCKVSFSTACCK